MNSKNLPQDYVFYKNFDLKQNKKIYQLIQLLSFLIIASMTYLAIKFNFSKNTDWNFMIIIIVTILICMVYIVVHELVHGIFIKLLSGDKPKYYIRFPLFAVGSEKTYFDKLSFIWIALSPVIILGGLLLALLFIVPSNFFLIIYIVLILNTSGASGDFIQTYIIAKLPKGSLIQDTGKETTIHIPNTNSQ